MTAIESADFGVLAAIAAMAVATYAMRAGGFWMMRHVPPSPRLRKMLEALPGSVIVATVLPIVVRDGITAMLAIGAAVAVMLLTRRDILAVVAGMAVAAARARRGMVRRRSPCRCRTASIRSASCSRMPRAALVRQSRRALPHRRPDVDATALGVAHLDLLRARIQESPPRRLGPLLHRAVLPRRGDRARRRPPALLRMPPQGCGGLRRAVAAGIQAPRARRVPPRWTRCCIAERLDGRAKRLHRRAIDDLPDGACRRMEAGRVRGARQRTAAMDAGGLRRAPAPAARRHRRRADAAVDPRVLAAGYRPQWHPSAGDRA